MENEGCKLCNQKPVFEDYPSIWHPDCYNKEESCRALVSSCYGDEVRMGVDRDGKIVLWASGEADSDFYYPNFCLNCGRKLKND